MKKSFLQLCGGSLALLLVLSGPAWAGGRKKKAPEHHETLIQSVSADSITVSENKATKTYPITPTTEITVKGQRAQTSDLKNGMMVSVTLGIDGVSVRRINAEDAPEHREDDRKNAKMPKGWMK